VRDYGPDERRKFERIDIPAAKQILVLDSKGKTAGVLRQLGARRLYDRARARFPRDSKLHHFLIHEQEEQLLISIGARVRYSDPRWTGFEFVDLDAEAAVEIGILIGKIL